MEKESTKISGYVRLVVKNKEGNILQDTGFQKNTITNGALAVFSGLVGATGAQTAFTYLAVGTDATAALASQTTLIAEISDSGLARHAATITRSTTTQTNDTLQLDYTWTVTGSKTVNEIGVFNASSSGVMAARKVTGAISVANGNSLLATYKIIFS
jgi:hypothetical protein